MSWTDERVSMLKQLWGQGKTASQIADILGEGVTRNAVIGKAHRLKLSSRVSPVQQNRRKTVVRAPVAKRERRIPVESIGQPKKEPTIQVGGGYSLVELEMNMCRWPEGDPKEDNFHFCGEKTISGLPYCPHHSMRAYHLGKVGKAEAQAQAIEIEQKKNSRA